MSALNDRQLTLLRKITVRLRELQPYLQKIEQEIDEDRTLLPERLWRSQIDDEACEMTAALDSTITSLDEAIGHITEITGESLPPLAARNPPPFGLPTHDEVDGYRRLRAAAIRTRRAESI